jgi:hypothetical protein
MQSVDREHKKKKRAPTEHTSLLQQIFGTGYPEEDEEIVEEQPVREDK